MSKGRRIAAAVAGLALVAAIGAGVVAATSGAAKDELRQPQAAGPQASEDAMPAPLRRVMSRSESAVAEFELDATSARGVPLRTRGGHAWVVPGEAGTCLFIGDGGGGCSHADEVAAGGLIVISPPAPADVGEIKPGGAMRLAPGPATVVGLAPAGVTEATVLDERGGVVAQVRPRGGVYELSLAQADGWSLEADWRVELDRGDGRRPLSRRL